MIGRLVAVTAAFTLFVAGGCGDNRGPSREEARDQRYQELLDSGRTALLENRYEQAVKDLEEASSLRDNEEVQALLVQARKERDAARKAAYDLALSRGRDAMEAPDYPAAVVAFREALNQMPNDTEAAVALREAEFHDYFEKGQAAMMNELYADAVKSLWEAVKRKPENMEAQELLKQAQAARRRQAMALGQGAMVVKKYAEAVRCFTEAKNLQSDVEVVALLKEAQFQNTLQSGMQHLQARQFAAAIVELEEANRLRPNLSDVQEALLKAREGKKLQDKADYDRAMSAGTLAIQAKNYQGAINSFNEALQKQPNDTLAGAKLREAQDAKARKDSYDRHISQGRMLMSAKNYVSAEMEFRLAQTDMPGDFTAQTLILDVQRLRMQQDQQKSKTKPVK